jgi:hypothetical protein
LGCCTLTINHHITNKEFVSNRLKPYTTMANNSNGQITNSLIQTAMRNGQWRPLAASRMPSRSWFDLTISPPRDPRILIANATLGATPGTFTRSKNFVGAATWVASPFNLTGNIICNALRTDDNQDVADAAQWTMQHQCGNFAASNPPALQRMIFLRAGTRWSMTVPINLGGATYSDLQIGFRNNGTSVGNFAAATSGSYPVIIFNGGLSATVNLVITVKTPGLYQMAISARDGSGNNSFFDMDWVVVP